MIPFFTDRNRHGCVVDLMVKTGAHFPPDDPEVSRELCIAAGSNDLECIKLWHRANVDMNCTDLDGRTPLHVVSNELHPILVTYESQGKCCVFPSNTKKWGTFYLLEYGG